MSTSIPDDNHAPTLDDNIAALHKKLQNVEDPEKFSAHTEALTQLYAIKTNMSPDRFSRDQLLAVGANLLGVILILNFERTANVTSKALGMVVKSRT